MVGIVKDTTVNLAKHYGQSYQREPKYHHWTFLKLNEACAPLQQTLVGGIAGS